MNAVDRSGCVAGDAGVSYPLCGAAHHRSDTSQCCWQAGQQAQDGRGRGEVLNAASDLCSLVRVDQQIGYNPIQPCFDASTTGISTGTFGAGGGGGGVGWRGGTHVSTDRLAP